MSKASRFGMKITRFYSMMSFAILFLSLSGCQLNAKQNGYFESAGTMCNNYNSHKTVLLKNGDVFLYGYQSGIKSSVQRPVSIAELYHPKSKKFECLPSPMVNQEFGFDAVLLQNGDVLITGGNSGLSKSYQAGDDVYANHGLASAQLYHARTKTFEKIGDMSVPRAGHKSILLQNGKVLIISGRSTHGPIRLIKQTVAQTAELYDEHSRIFTPLQMHLCYPNSQAVVLLSDRQLLITNSKNAELYDTNNEKFTCLPDFFKQGKGQALIPLEDGNVITFPAGTYRQSFPQTFNPNSKKFGTIPTPIPGQFEMGSTSLLFDGRVFFAGGRKSIGSIEYISQNTFFYNQKTQKFQKGPDMPFPREGHVSTVLNDGRVLFTGGSKGLFCCEKASEPELFIPSNVKGS